jgi:myosin-crossreactive antigen
MNKELLKIAKELEEIGAELEKGTEWGEANIEEAITEIERYAKDLRSLAETAIELNNLNEIKKYEAQAENLIENSINEMIEESK